MSKSQNNTQTGDSQKPKPSTPIRVVDTTTRSTVFKENEHERLVVKKKK